ncbi:MAG: DUF4832 domain-containing protein [Paludibacteraceae bacterium]|nr:DUF4832 domain-containing protein [Paludibacteraceae bacterium]
MTRFKLGSFILLSCLYSSVYAERWMQKLDYFDALIELENPYIGFYRTVGKHFTPEGNSAANTWGNLTHLRMDISAFSDKAVLSVNEATGDTTFGVSQPLTQDMLDAFEATLDGVRKRGKTAIVRFAYDPWFNGATKCDPDQSVILQHLRQLGEVYARNTDVITYVELGMYGSWGEMHSSNNGTNANIAEALQTLLECTPPEIKIGVRRPDIVAYWLKVNEENNYLGFDIDSEKFKSAAAAKGDTIYRVGMYNDGYLGSSTDLGTVGMGAAGHQMTREMMVKWLNRYSLHTPYGGELVANYNGDHPINTPDYLSREGFKTHTSYLNYEWHQPTILAWKDSIFQDEGSEYYGCDGYTYVVNHLGYRFVLRESILPDHVKKNLSIRLLIENVGFGNLTKSKKVTFLLDNGTKYYEVEPHAEIDPCEWLSYTVSTIETSILLPRDIEPGLYNVYIRLSEYGDVATDNNQYCIQFGNVQEQYNKKLGANLIGEVQIDGENTEIEDRKKDEPDFQYGNGALYLSNCEEIEIHTVEGKCLYHKTGIKGDAVVPLSLLEGTTPTLILVTLKNGKRQITKRQVILYK